ncbi:MAG TPA: zinc ribbon domain-containing protein [Thermoplasmata archaeon]|jgi:hypothetical protein|nr:zinc ribbon domain-containing protein [Thermoplasmata archaeon]
MFCPRCGRPLEGGEQFCPGCGNPLAPALSEATAPPGPPELPALLTTPELVMVRDREGGWVTFRFEDGSGRILGATRAEPGFPLHYTLLDDEHRPILHLDGVRERGLQYTYRILGPDGGLLASLAPQTSVLSRKYGVSVGGQPSLLLATNATGSDYALTTEPGGATVATGAGSGLLHARTAVTVAGEASVDRRIVLGAMILAGYFTTPRRT